MEALEAAWLVCFRDLGCTPPRAAYVDLTARYREPHRAYHTLQHLEECFGWFVQMGGQARRPGDLAFALFYHDAIYDTRAHDNEARSAALAADVLRGCGLDRADAVTDLILTTRHDALPADEDARILVDIDLSILGASPDRFDEYERQVRREYAWVDDSAFRAGRGRILRQFLDRCALFNTVFFRDRLEQQARKNLERSLRGLDAR
jgi:predicted metal-dependent HD superfamily phosphohydrolase